MANFEGITLASGQVEQLTWILSEVNLALKAMHDLAHTSTAPESEAICTAISNMAKVGCRKVDLIAEALGEDGFGNFAEEFQTPWRAVE